MLFSIPDVLAPLSDTMTGHLNERQGQWGKAISSYAKGIARLPIKYKCVEVFSNVCFESSNLFRGLAGESESSHGVHSQSIRRLCAL